MHNSLPHYLFDQKNYNQRQLIVKYIVIREVAKH